MAGREGVQARPGDPPRDSKEEVLAGLEDVRWDPGGALERESEGPVAEFTREWLRLGAAEASASE